MYHSKVRICRSILVVVHDMKYANVVFPLQLSYRAIKTNRQQAQNSSLTTNDHEDLVIAHSSNPPLLHLATASLQRLYSRKHQGHICSYTRSLATLISHDFGA